MEYITINNEDNIISNGLHYLSGIGDAQIEDDFYGGMIDARLFCIDGETYCVYTDPDDGYRSYGNIQKSNCKCQHTFEPQPIIAINKIIKGYCDEDSCYEIKDQKILVLTDAITGKEVLKVGTDYAEAYYPFSVFDYQPQNLYINQNK